MAGDLQNFLFKSKLFKKWDIVGNLVVILIVVNCALVYCERQEECSLACEHGICVDNKCLCDPGWKGPLCQWCHGKSRLWSNTSVITEGSGNYSTDTQCAWLIDAGKPNTSIHLHLDHFATECSWDPLYVYDGDSIYDPLIAVFSGLVAQDNYRNSYAPEIVTHSGQALLHFQSDAANTLSGFSISYSSAVDKNCSGNGVCIDGVCTCNETWGGSACSVLLCPDECLPHGKCIPEEQKCLCNPGYTGTDCSQAIANGWWEVVTHDLSSQLEPPSPESSSLERSSHATVLINNEIWVIGGYSFMKKSFLLKYNIEEKKWLSVESKSIKNPTARYGHTAVAYNESIYMYGGTKEDGNISRELWRLDVDTLKWSLLSSDDEPIYKDRPDSSTCPGPCAPISCVGHASVVVWKNKWVMLVFFGYSSRYGFLNTVQEYDFDQGTWSTLETKGAVVNGVYGHTAVWDPLTSLVYVHGGLHSIKTATYVVPDLVTFDPSKLVWELRSSAPIPRFLHSAVLTEGLMLVFGGNTHNDTAYSNGAKCYSADFLVYDITCNAWHTLQKSNDLYLDVARFGHNAILHDGAMYVLGGFNGKMLGSALRYHLGNCSKILTTDDCILAYPGRKCTWNRILDRCETISDQDNESYDVCPSITVRQNLTALCNELSSCRSCISNIYGCSWCGSTCTHGVCSEFDLGIASIDDCEDNQLSKCEDLDTCQLCKDHQSCNWIDGRCAVANIAEQWNPGLAVSGDRQCESTCAERTTCANCTGSKGACVWCFNKQRCIDNNSYLVSFPYGQCREWTTEDKKCPKMEKGMSRCNTHQTCSDCQADVACGWCDDGSGTGTGTCMEGGQRGPVDPITGAVQEEKCDKTQWSFTQCPSCNCNGHSYCQNGNQCLMPCANNTTGSKCEYCDEKFFGNPLNGGSCKPCMCNGHGDTCDGESGRCKCHTKGVIGDHCEICDSMNNYHFADHLNNTCFYDLHLDYLFTFDLTRPKDTHIRQINFLNVPTKIDVDTDFNITCSKEATIEISAKTPKSDETWILRNYTGLQLKRTFSSSEYMFGSADSSTTFYVYVSNFTAPIEIKVAFAQHPKINLFSLFNSFSL